MTDGPDVPTIREVITTGDGRYSAVAWITRRAADETDPNGTLTYYSTGLGEDITTPVERGDSARPHTFGTGTAAITQALVELGRQLTAHLTPAITALAQLGAALERTRQAKVSRAWTDPQARWDMWDRKTHRTRPAWNMRQVGRHLAKVSNMTAAAAPTPPSPYELWKQAGGEDDSFNKQRYRELLIEHGHLRPLEPGEKAEPLPCGWPNNRYPDDQQWLETAHLTTAEQRQALGPRPWSVPTFEEDDR